MSEENQKANNAVVDLEHARARLRSRAAKASPESVAVDLEGVRGLLDQGLTIEARSRLNSLLAQARNQPSLLAQARCALSVSLEMQGQYRESLEAVAMYEDPESRAKLDANLNAQLRVQISLAHNYNGDHPKAIALLNATLRDLPEEGAEVGAVYVALARVYRSIAEYPIARDYSHRALESYRQTGDWRGLAEAYFGQANADLHEGHPESSLENFGQALKLIGDHPATFLLGRIYANMAGACWFLKRP
ncbi:MAG TPA: tetratricopeptide repeat protein, partial [Pyrinomonadaceae bacterium]|nr:tetratricopeptide repeat protein [Pyrinomonadaceae bacterium]